MTVKGSQDSGYGLVADIGATHARFALAEPGGITGEQILLCADYQGFVAAAQAYLAQMGGIRPVRGLAAVAGPVQGDEFTLTNHPWRFSTAAVRTALGLEQFILMNDFEAVARAIPHLAPGDTRAILPGRPQAGRPIGVIGPGTGLGVASLVWDGRRYISVPGEGGHVTIAARTVREFAVIEWLGVHKYSHVSAERVCSGKGLVNLYDALRSLDGRGDLPDLSPPEISARALSGACPLCAEALAMMMAFLGVAAGNLALTLGAFGGIYIAGGVVLQLGDYFEKSGFAAAFKAKGRMSAYLEDVPVRLVTHPCPAFIGLQAALAGQ